jgi:biopolymer transport protein ExbD
MAEKRQFLDVWIVESNTVYREVPFAVVTDWVQQGRLLEDDMLRPSGTKDWLRLGGMSAFAAYLPKPEPFRVEDEAEALEAVEIDFAWQPRTEDEDQDVDMIPLIDVSLVLLIFFMMTTSISTAVASKIVTPQADYGTKLVNDNTILWVGIDRPQGQRPPLYSVGRADQGAAAENRDLTEAQALQRVEALLKEGGPAKIRIRADRTLPYEVVKHLTVALQLRRGQGVREIFGDVSEGGNP